MNVLLNMEFHNSGNRRNLYLISVAGEDASIACFAVKKMAGSCFKLNILPHVKEAFFYSWLAKIFKKN